MSTTSGVSMTGRPSPPRSAPSLGISRGRACSQMRYGKTLLERFPELSAVFLAGVVDFRVIAAAIFRTDLLTDTDALATIDAQLTATAPSWNTLSRDPPAVLPNSSPVQDVSRRACRMDPDTAARRHPHLDLTTRAHLHHHTHRRPVFPNSGSPPRSWHWRCPPENAPAPKTAPTESSANAPETGPAPPPTHHPSDSQALRRVLGRQVVGAAAGLRRLGRYLAAGWPAVPSAKASLISLGPNGQVCSALA